MKKCIPLTDLPLRKRAKILNFEMESIPIKLLEMGLLPETQISIIAKAPFGGPYVVQYGNEFSRLSLRLEEASSILVEEYE